MSATRRFAEDTTVPIEKSKAEIESLLTRYGATRFASGWDESGATIVFSAEGRMVRFFLPLPRRDDAEFAARMVRGYRTAATPAQAQRAWEQACRTRWRALALVVKAKLEAVASKITTFEAEFLAYIVLPDGTEVGKWLRPQIEAAYASGKMPPMLPAASDDERS